jgi:predicted DNA-binding transcriptional regulator YafY
MRQPRKAGRPVGKFTQHRKLDKLRDILTASPNGLSLAELSIALRVSPRSVRRYLGEYARIEEIESVPLARGGAHVWRIKPGERSRKVALRRVQAFGLLALRPSLACFAGSALHDELESAFQEVARVAQRPVKATTGGALPRDVSLEGRLLVHTRGAQILADSELIDTFFQAIVDRRAVVVSFHEGVLNRPASLLMAPRGLGVFEDELFVLGPCLPWRKDEVDELVPVLVDARVDPIALMTVAEATILEHAVADDPAFSLDGYTEGAFGFRTLAQPERVVVEFARELAVEVRARKWHPSQRVAMSGDGRVRLVLTTPNLPQVMRWVMSYGSKARVIEPPALQARMDEELRAMRTQGEERGRSKAK